MFIIVEVHTDCYYPYVEGVDYDSSYVTREAAEAEVNRRHREYEEAIARDESMRYPNLHVVEVP